jgi:hypothetical protein
MLAGGYARGVPMPTEPGRAGRLTIAPRSHPSAIAAARTFVVRHDRWPVPAGASLVQGRVAALLPPSGSRRPTIKRSREGLVAVGWVLLVFGLAAVAQTAVFASSGSGTLMLTGKPPRVTKA